MKEGLTDLAACHRQKLRLRAFHCLRDSYEAMYEAMEEEGEEEGEAEGEARRVGSHGLSHGLGPALLEEMELGPFGNLGMGIGSRPRTPLDERAMSGWSQPHVDDGLRGLGGEVAEAVEAVEAGGDRGDRGSAAGEHPRSIEDEREWLMADLGAPYRKTSLTYA